MENTINLKEILLVMNTSLFSKDWIKRNNGNAEKNFTHKEKLIDACWDGLIPEILPECFTDHDQALTLWQVNHGSAFIDLEFCAVVQPKEKVLSINPYEFMEVQGYN